ncbi:LITAF-like zinc ribbon domain protein [Gregarina niphandrodes]|uniref:LITAF-like zinc ribbon domain protein n=1 Tax=Gregarina niphandrodes TaxID=110365 RepID=A0A023B6L3_GRENI|nr:LITAF-like zinc ribbon domain protein [Gregarina niphandrodes]EZG66594.1 LITAF-like zinc ribbon domain protein [Gregarina niphandrodes]|eukprot:XP_011130580.1 LITAF-like zinc ribbon domain protein [Gregarina niphandrodes]
MKQSKIAVAPDQDETLNYYDEPLKLYCHACERQVISRVKQKSNWETYTILVLLLLLTGIVGVCVFPLVRQYTRDASHRCPSCKSEIVRYKRFRMPAVSNEVITLQCGNCAVVLAKRYFVGFTALAFLIMVLSLTKTYLKSFKLPDLEPGEPINQSWQDFIDDCGTSSNLGNPLKTRRNFNEIYYGKSATNWQGRINHVRLGVLGKNFIFVNMPLHDKSSSTDPDVGLIYSSDTWDDVVSDFERGDLVMYNATLLELGSRSEPTLASLDGIIKITSNEDLPPMYPSVS